MYKRLLLASSLLVAPSAAFAQAWSGPGQQTVSYPGGGSGSYTGILGDGSTASGGTPPAYATSEPADIGAAAAGYTYSDWTSTTGLSRVDASPNEEKVRFVCNSSHVAQEDPILFPGQALSGHPHEFVGNTLAGKDSDYDTLRTTGASTCPGGPINRTAYWKPAVLKDLGTGLSAVIRSDLEIFYYTHASGEGVKKSRIPNDYAFIGGANPADPTNSARLAEIPSGFVKGGAAETGPNGDGFIGWECRTAGGALVAPSAGGTHTSGFVTTGGADPWGGNCTSGMSLVAVVMAPPCWDGKNATSPDGRSHVRYKIRHSNSGRLVCPNNWYEVMQFEAKSYYSHEGWADYSQWYLASDRHGLAQANWKRAGTTFHFDWMNGWDPQAIDDWQVNCGGLTFTGNPNPGECNSSTISHTTRLLLDTRPSCAGPPACSTLANNPIVNQGLKYYNDGVGRFYPVEEFMEVGPGELHHGVPPSQN